ncbi:hypothetical protein CDL12_22652 [Handroanthus impetiginosus]|uniref:Calmodulin-binding protein 60 A-like n=1 Tax=Handroanthus impetiginosus TaxID=429701 RepID=A0A2G9GHP6_9LAMI|nr:hypothetical protein CDL12_22652 [Handroanthus impetiginosus]
MELNVQLESGSDQATSSDDVQFALDFRKIMKKQIKVMVIDTVRQEIVPIVENLVRKVVKEEIQSAQENFLTGGNRGLENETAVSNERSLCLKFLDKVSLPVLTGKVIEGEGGTPIKVALVDKITEEVVKCVPESSSKVEILILEANNEVNEGNWSVKDFNNRIISEGDKEKPHFAKRKYINLKDGTGTLCDTKLGHGADWMKSCKCRLGARMESFGGIKVQEAWTESFMVSDSRSKLYGKHYPPSLSDDVWRLKNIGKNGARRKRLNNETILTVQDFLFLHSIDPHKLQQIVHVHDEIWKETLAHAQTCVLDDQRMHLYYPSSESRMGVVFDVVGRLKGAIHDSRYVPDSNLLEAEQDFARKLLLSAFEYRKNIIPFDNENASRNENNIIAFDNENALLQQFPSRSSCNNAPTNFVTPEGPRDNDLQVSQRINGYDRTEPGTSSQIGPPSITPSDCPNNNYDFGSANMEQFCDPRLGVFNRSLSFSEFDHLLENLDNFDSLRSLLFPETNNVSETPMANSHSHRQRKVGRIRFVGAVSFLRLNFRARKRVMDRVMALQDIHVQKRQRT